MYMCVYIYIYIYLHMCVYIYIYIYALLPKLWRRAGSLLHACAEPLPVNRIKICCFQRGRERERERARELES